MKKNKMAENRQKGGGIKKNRQNQPNRKSVEKISSEKSRKISKIREKNFTEKI